MPNESSGPDDPHGPLSLNSLRAWRRRGRRGQRLCELTSSNGRRRPLLSMSCSSSSERIHGRSSERYESFFQCSVFSIDSPFAIFIRATVRISTRGPGAHDEEMGIS